MSKKTLNKISLNDIGLSERFIQEASIYGDNLYLARVSVQLRDVYKVITEKGEISAKVSGKLMYSSTVVTDYPAVGDWVMVDRVEAKTGNAIIHHILTRRSCFERKAPGKGHEHQIIAANIDTVFICMSLNNDYNLRRVERYLAIAWDSNAAPVVLLTKADLCEDSALRIREIETVAPGVDVLQSSCVAENGLKELSKYLTRGKTVAFIGSSGVGKSSIINKLLGAEVLATNGLRDDDKGRHTTTHRQMFILPDGGIVIDTPGIREIQIAGADLSKTFADIEELAGKCFFRDCKHESEPRCAVRKAIEDGALSVERFNSFKKLQKEALFEERKLTMTASQAEKEKVVDMMGSLSCYKQIRKNLRKNKGNK